MPSSPPSVKRPPHPTLGQNIRAARQSRGIDQRSLAIAIGQKGDRDGSSYISKVENDQYSPQVDTLQRIAQALGTTVGRLIGEPVKNGKGGRR